MSSNRDLLAKLTRMLEALGCPVEQRSEEIRRLARKLELLATTSRYRSLIRHFFACNDSPNLDAMLLEVEFAHAFESKQRPLLYEVKQDKTQTTTVDFMRQTSNSRIFFELRALSEKESIRGAMEGQLAEKGSYCVTMDGKGERKGIIRLQNTILSKCQNNKLKPIKFLSLEKDTYNIIAIDVGSLNLGAIDRYDCIVAAQGDGAVLPTLRHGVVGLFEDTIANSLVPCGLQTKKFAIMRERIHGVLFLNRRGGNHSRLDFTLRGFLVTNPVLMPKEGTRLVQAEIDDVIDPWNDDVSTP